MFELSILPPKAVIGPYFITYDSLGFWAGKQGEWECSYNRDGWIYGRVPKKRQEISHEEETSGAKETTKEAA